MLDVDKLTDAMVTHTMSAIEHAVEPLLARIHDLEVALSDPTPPEVAEPIDPAPMVHEAVKEAVAALPAAKNGEPGLGFDDLDLIHDGERTFTFKLHRGEQTLERSFVIPAIIDRGIYDEKGTYEKGDAVTYGGSIWVANGITRDKPGTSKGWRLAVKRGAKGRDAVVKAEPEPQPLKTGVPKDETDK